MSQKEAGKRPHRAAPPFPPPSCPRCSSGNTKFCYYNNYSVSQPRYICKNCRRYWTHGGVVRNIPSSRKWSRADSKPSTTGMLVPQPSLAGSFMQEELTDFQRNTVGTLVPLGSHDNRVGGGVGSSVGCVTFQPPITQTMQSFGGSGGFFNQTAFEFIQGGVNTAFNGVNVASGGGAPRLSPLFTPMFTRHSGFDGFGDFGSSFIQRPQFQPPPTMAVNSLSTTLTSANDLLPIARDPNAAAANVVSIKEWSELDDMESESDPLQSYKQSVP